MSHVLIIHEVEDYPAWKKIFDEAAGIRKEAGERSYQILKYQDDPNRSLSTTCMPSPNFPNEAADNHHHSMSLQCTNGN